MTRTVVGLSIVLMVAAACRNASSPREGITSPSRATLEQGTIATTHLFGHAPDMTTVFGPAISVVSAGVELRNFGATVFVNGQPTSGFVDIDFSATNILITLTRDQPSGFFDTLRFADADGTLRDFTDVRVNPATSYAGVNASRIRVEPDIIDLNLTALRGLRGQAISLDVGVSPTSRRFQLPSEPVWAILPAFSAISGRVGRPTASGSGLNRGL